MISAITVSHYIFKIDFITISAEVQSKRTYCDYEFTVDMERMKNITYNTSEQKPPPFSKLVAINIVSSLNGNNNEVIFLSESIKVHF